jgi:hypothetical protein
MSHLVGPVLELLKANSDLDQKYYPEGLHRLYVVNAPSVAKIGWAIIKLWIDARVQQKIVFVGPADTKRVLLEAIAPENLPEFLGGSCQCEGECVPSLVEGEPDESDASLTQELVVRSGSKAQKVVEVGEGKTLAWAFVVVTMNLNFNVAFLPAGAKSPTPIAQLERATSGDGAFTAPVAGAVVLTFDNSFSWLKSKTVQLRTSVIEAAAETVSEAEQAATAE